jgi:hypothetical protein
MFALRGRKTLSGEIGMAAPTGPGVTEFKECLRHLHDGNKFVALLHARRALDREPRNPFYLSYVGVLVAITEKRYAYGESLCREALAMKYNHAQLYLNLAQVCHEAGRDRDATVTLQKGFISTGHDLRICRALEKVGGRRAPVMPFVHRTNSLNRILGRLRHRLIGPRRAR